MEACLLQLPQRLLLLGAAALTATVLETGKYEGAWLGYPEDGWAPTILREYVSPVSTRLAGLRPFELEEAGKLCFQFAWHPQVQP